MKKRHTINTVKGIALILGGSYLMLLTAFITTNVWASSTLFYEFWVDWLARSVKWQLALILFAVFAIGAFLLTAGVTFFWRRFKKTDSYSILKRKFERCFR